MKRACAFFLLFLILFNTIGYYGVLLLFEQQLTTRMIHKIDESVAEIGGDLMLTYPVNLPYAEDSENYERVDGKVVYGGEVFRLVKQKYYHNNLYVICIRDDRSSQIREVIDEYSKTFTNQQPDNSKSAIKIVVSSGKYYLVNDNRTSPVSTGWNRALVFAPMMDLYFFDKNSSVFHPPQQA